MADEKSFVKEDLMHLLSEDEVRRPSSRSDTTGCTFSVLVFTLIAVVVGSIGSSVLLENRRQHPFHIPTPPPPVICETSPARPSWHSLPRHRQHGYVRAVQRLASLPSRLGLNTSRYDDFTYAHTQLVYQNHHAAISLPYHRYFVHLFEQALRNEGGYDNPIPYWDWTLDASDPLSSPVWDAWAGFGGNGSETAGGCVEDGVFERIGKVANYSSDGYQPHCLTRSFTSAGDDGVMHSQRWNKDVIAQIVESSQTFEEFRERLEHGPHRYLHWGIGGEMPTSHSTNDPIFFLHHAQTDRLWWIWQQKDSERRDRDFSGPGPDGGSESSASMTDRIRVLGLGDDVSVADVMTTNTATLCYKYSREL